MKKLYCDICGKELTSVGHYLGNPVFRVLDVEDVCESCASLFYRGREEFSEFVAEAKVAAQAQVKASIKEGSCALKNKGVLVVV